MRKVSAYMIVFGLLASTLFTSGIVELEELQAYMAADVDDDPFVEGADFVYDMGDYIWWNHATDELEIVEGEVDTYSLTINQDLLGATITIDLEIVDKLWQIEPDLDLYLYSPDGEIANHSAQEKDRDESIVFEFNQTGTWLVEVEAYDGDGPYILYRDVLSNAAPWIESVEYNIENPAVYDPIYIDACDSYDMENGYELDFDWTLSDSEIVFTTEEEIHCDVEVMMLDTNAHTLELEVTDEWGLSSTASWDLQAVNPGWDSASPVLTQQVQLNDSLQFTFENLGPMFTPGIRMDGEKVGVQLGLQYDVILESAIDFDYEFELVANSNSSLGHSLFLNDFGASNVDRTVSFKPSIVLNIQVGQDLHELNIPMLSNMELYEGQPSFSLANYSFNLYYWADYVEFDTVDVDGSLMFTGFEEFLLAEVDLYPIIEWMIDNIGNMMGQTWVDTATNILEKFIDISVPLEFNVDLEVAGLHAMQMKPSCDACSIEPEYMMGPVMIEGMDFPPSVDIEVLSDEYSAKISSGILTLFYVSVTPNIDLAFELNDVRIWEMDVFDFAEMDNEYVTSSASGTYSEFTWMLDTDGDGYKDSVDHFPNNSSEWLDSDSDGYGDNSDAFPEDPSEWSDRDGDGAGDNSDAFPDDSSEWLDSDSDTVGDNADAFPEDASETTDSDEDGTGDNADVFPNDPTETTDSDSDGVGDNSDAFPSDSSETLDSDNDGVGDNSDAFPDDSSETLDSDGDGVGDNTDAYPQDAKKTVMEEEESEGLPGFTFYLSLSSILVAAFAIGRRD